ncbi:MAG: sulfur carrier protein [Limisphaerales bacterium]|jgi:sulfur carrier protein
MELLVNGKPYQSIVANLAGLLSDLQLHDQKGIAVAVNDSVIPRGNWESTLLSKEDRVTIIKATAGG